MFSPTRLAVIALVLSSAALAQSVHPRIWLDATVTARLKTLVASNDPSWTAVKARADTLLALSVPQYAQTDGTGICYWCGAYPNGGAYQGSGWSDAIMTLSMAYRLTGNIAYATQVKNILNVMAQAGAAPLAVNSGYPARNVVLGLAIGYDWIYDQLSAADIKSYTILLDAYWTWLQTSDDAYAWSGRPNPDDNYYSGYIVGFGLAALAMEGDSNSATSIQSTILDSFKTNLSGPSGVFQNSGAGGYPIEGFNYGQGSFGRFLQYMWGMRTAGKEDLLSAESEWIRAAARSTMFNLKPDMWSTTDEGDFTGTYSRIMTRNYPLFLAHILTTYGGYAEGQWMQWLYKSMSDVPISESTPQNYMACPLEALLYNSGSVAVDYADQPLSYFSRGDMHSYVRSTWGREATWTSFHAGTKTHNIGNYTSHQNKTAGHIAIQRGDDYLLIGAHNWHGNDGISGQPISVLDGGASWKFNTLFYWDGGGVNGGTCLNQVASDGQYAGCQMFWSPDNNVTHKETADYTFATADLRPAYFDNHGTTTIDSYFRTFLSIGGDVVLVYDRIAVASASATRQLHWNTPASSLAATPGTATALSVAGSVASATVGNSTLWIKTLLPLDPSISQVTNTRSWSDVTEMGTQRFVVSDPKAGASTKTVFLTVLAPTDAGVPSMPASALINEGNYTGATYNDGVTPRVGLFSKDGTPQSVAVYSVDYESSKAGRHVVLDLMPGLYSVSKDGVLLHGAIRVEADGSMSFEGRGGGRYAVTPLPQRVHPPGRRATPGFTLR